jgi:hypothetical protein
VYLVVPAADPRQRVQTAFDPADPATLPSKEVRVVGASTYVCICAEVCMHVPMHVCMCADVCMHVCRCMYACAYVYMYVCRCMYACAYACVYVCRCMCVRVYADVWVARALVVAGGCLCRRGARGRGVCVDREWVAAGGRRRWRRPQCGGPAAGAATGRSCGTHARRCPGGPHHHHARQRRHRDAPLPGRSQPTRSRPYSHSRTYTHRERPLCTDARG